MKIDLQLHSTASDGELCPKEVMRECKKAGLKVVALTDHDTIAGVKEALSEAQDLGIKFIPGIEFNSDHLGLGVHILGLGIDPDNRVLSKAISRIKLERVKRAEKIIKLLEARGFKVDRSVLKNTGSITRPGIAGAVANRGMSVSEFVSRWIDEARPCFVERRRLTSQEAIKIIHSAGGKAIWAHPGYTMRNYPLDLMEIARQLVDLGLDGLEVFYSQHTKKQTREAFASARILGLLISAGSDFHGFNHFCHEVGNFSTHGLKFETEKIIRVLS